MAFPEHSCLSIVIMPTNEDILKSAESLYKRTKYAAHLNNILCLLYDELYPELNHKENIRQFLNDYQIMLLRCLVLELCVIHDKPSSHYHQYSFKTIISDMQRFLLDSDNNDISLFKRPEKLRLAVSDGLIQDLEEYSDSLIFETIDNTYTSFSKNNVENFELLKTLRDKFLAHPETGGNSSCPCAEFLKEASLFSIRFANLLLVLLSTDQPVMFTKVETQNLLSIKEEYYRDFFKRKILN